MKPPWVPTSSGRSSERPPTTLATVVSPPKIGSLLPALGISERKLNKLLAISTVREQRRNGGGQKAYSARPFVLCGIPVRRPPPTTLEYFRQNGNFSLRVIGHPRFGLPFGQDRLLLIWIASLTTWQKTRVVRFASAAAILETFGLPKDGRYYKRLIAGFERIFYSTFYFTNDQREGETVIITRTSFRFVRDLKLWYTEEGKQPSDSRRENVIVLSEEFWKEIRDHPVPVDLSVVKALADSPGNLDFYIWLVWRCWTAKGHVYIPLFGPGGLVQQLGLSNNLRDRDFRRQIKRWLGIVDQLWPESPARLVENSEALIVTPCRSQ